MVSHLLTIGKLGECVRKYTHSFRRFFFFSRHPSSSGSLLPLLPPWWRTGPRSWCCTGGTQRCTRSARGWGSTRACSSSGTGSGRWTSYCLCFFFQYMMMFWAVPIPATMVYPRARDKTEAPHRPFFPPNSTPCRALNCLLSDLQETTVGQLYPPAMEVSCGINLVGPQLLIFWSNNMELLEIDFFCLLIPIWGVGK